LLRSGETRTGKKNEVQVYGNTTIKDYQMNNFVRSEDDKKVKLITAPSAK